MVAVEVMRLPGVLWSPGRVEVMGLVDLHWHDMTLFLSPLLLLKNIEPKVDDIKKGSVKRLSKV